MLPQLLHCTRTAACFPADAARKAKELPGSLHLYTWASTRFCLEPRRVVRQEQRVSQVRRSVCSCFCFTQRGASVSEVLSVRSADIDVRRKQITFRATVSKPGRTLPIGSDLAYAVSQYLENGHPTIRLEALIFLTPLGGMLSRPNLCARFKRLRSIAGIEAESAECTPRLQDLRYTFAVHRLQSWIEAGTNLNELLPALSAYMGYASLTAAEQFLAYVPERFREDVQKLSPSKGVRRWSDDTVLMSFLTQL